MSFSAATSAAAFHGPQNPLMRPLSKLQKAPIDKEEDVELEDTSPSLPFLSTSCCASNSHAGGRVQKASSTSLRFSTTAATKTLSNFLRNSSSNLLLESDFMLSQSSVAPPRDETNKLNLTEIPQEEENSFSIETCSQENNDLDLKVKKIASEGVVAEALRLPHAPSTLLFSSQIISSVNTFDPALLAQNKDNLELDAHDEIEGGILHNNLKSSQIKLSHFTLKKRNSFTGHMFSSAHAPAQISDCPSSLQGSPPSISTSMYTPSGIHLSQQPSSQSFKTILKKERSIISNSISTDNVLDSGLLVTQKTLGKVSFNDQREVLSYEEGAEEKEDKRTTSQYDDILFFDEFEDDPISFSDKFNGRFHQPKSIPPTQRQNSKNSRSLNLNSIGDSQGYSSADKKSKPSTLFLDYDKAMNINDIISSISDSPLFSQQFIPSEDSETIEPFDDHVSIQANPFKKTSTKVIKDTIKTNKILGEGKSSQPNRTNNQSNAEETSKQANKSKTKPDEAKLKAIMDRIRITHPKDLADSGSLSKSNIDAVSSKK